MEISETAKPYKNQECEMEIFPSFKYVFPYVRGKRVLDLGCGRGEYLKYFGSESMGIDVSEPNVKVCEEKGLNVIRWDLNRDLPFSEEGFEAIFISHTIEHLDAPIHILRESYRVLMPKGLIIIGVPHVGGLARLLSDDYFDNHEGHLYAFSLKNIKILLTKTGFRFKKLYFNLSLVKRLRLLFLMDWAQRLPFGFVSFIADGIWVIGERTGDNHSRA